MKNLATLFILLLCFNACTNNKNSKKITANAKAVNDCISKEYNKNMPGTGSYKGKAVLGGVTIKITSCNSCTLTINGEELEVVNLEVDSFKWYSGTTKAGVNVSLGPLMSMAKDRCTINIGEYKVMFFVPS